MYTRFELGVELKRMLIGESSITEIANWALTKYWDNIHNIENGADDVLIALYSMKEGKEFEISYDRLNEIAYDLFCNRYARLE